MKIAEAVLEPQRMKLGDGARELLVSHFEAEKANREPDAKGSNGRGVRNLLEAAKRAQALRLADVKGQRQWTISPRSPRRIAPRRAGGAALRGGQAAGGVQEEGILQPVIRG